MSRMSVFNSPLLLGFDHIERLLDTVSKSGGEGYPPYNIEQIGSDSLRITLAVAGFAREDIEITIEENQLVIRGRQAEDGAERVFLHRGIAGRQFQRRFVLAEGIEVIGASIENGLLHIDLTRPRPAVRTRTIEITAGHPGRDRTTIDLQARESR